MLLQLTGAVLSGEVKDLLFDLWGQDFSLVAVQPDGVAPVQNALSGSLENEYMYM